MATLRRKVKDLELSEKKKRQVDFDPEDEPFSKQYSSGDDTTSEESANENVGREHYQVTIKSKLRKPEKTSLDEKKYGGQAVSRDKVFRDDDYEDVLVPDEDEDEDPFAAVSASASEDEAEEEEEDLLNGETLDGEVDGDEEIDSEGAFEVGEEDEFRGKGFVFRGSGKQLASLPTGSDNEDEEDEEDQMTGSEDKSDVSDDEDVGMDMDDLISSEHENSQEEDLEDGEEDEEQSETDEESARPLPSAIRTVGNKTREELKALISSDTAALASSLSATLSADAKKGSAVKKQYQTFDRLLDARIKLQKGLIGANDLGNSSDITNEEVQTALKKAEEAALKLYATIESLRYSILNAQTNVSTTSNSETPPSKKRKRPSPPTSSIDNTDLWSRLTTLESQTLPNRNTILDKWSSKTRAAVPLPSTSKLTNSSQQPDSKLSTVISAYLASETPKLLSSSQPTPQSYDDSAFYQSLLRDLINSRATSNPNGLQTNVPVVPIKLHPSGNVSKSRKIDTKASKGRKIRYTVHEKLENFMAGEGTGNVVGQWNDGAVREFFGSLLGQSGLLGEVEDKDIEMDVDVEEDREVEALRLFRT